MQKSREGSKVLKVENLQKLRDAKSVTNQEIAEFIGLSYRGSDRYISKVLLGKETYVSQERLTEIKEAIEAISREKAGVTYESVA